jgi:hypothetical protein
MYELLFFFVGVLPYWFALALPQKDRRFWLVLLYCNIIWIMYYSFHQTPLGVLNNFVEAAIALNGLKIARRTPTKN